MYVIDGIARPIANLMNINDIEQISVLKDHVHCNVIWFSGNKWSYFHYNQTRRTD